MTGIVILTYNTWDVTKECVNSILSSHIGVPYKIYLVDNHSETSCTAEIEKIIKDNGNITYIRAKENRGYSAGNNIGIKEALRDHCEYILIANNDIIFTDDILTGLTEFLEKNKKAGIAAPKIILPDGKTQETNLGCKMTLRGKYLWILRNTPLGFLSRRFCNKFHIDIDRYHSPLRVFGVSGCCFLFRSECVKEIGCFDENTFLYEEENIISCKMECKGYDTYIIPAYTVIHHHGYSTNANRPAAYAAFVESEIYYCRKYLKAPGILLIWLSLIRILNYVFLCGKSREYRSYFGRFLKKSVTGFFRNI